MPALRALVEVSEVTGVVCQPDRPAGRGLELAEPAVKRAAREVGLVVHQPVKVKTGNLDEWVDDEAGLFVGGFYARSTREGCESRISAHAPIYYDYSTGARCCRAPLP